MRYGLLSAIWQHFFVRFEGKVGGTALTDDETTKRPWAGCAGKNQGVDKLDDSTSSSKSEALEKK